MNTMRQLDHKEVAVIGTELEHSLWATDEGALAVVGSDLKTKLAALEVK
jgi:hypothetical protein